MKDSNLSTVIYTVIFTFIFSSCQISLAQIPEASTIDSIFAEWDKPNSPGGSLGIIREGKLIYARGYGMANLEYDIPNDANSVFRIGSTSKQFTAACIVLLAKEGKLTLEDKLNDFFPDFPPYADQITIRHLLNHTSGIRDYLLLSSLKGFGPDDYFENHDIMQWLIRQQELNFSPGDEFLYSNSGYWLLGQIVEQVSGQNMADFAKAEIFDPLNMNHTHFHNDHNQIVKNRSSGYSPEDSGKYKISMTTLDMIGDGGVFTTINDMVHWNNAYYESDILTPDFWELMTEQGILNNGDTLDYASGLTIGNYRGLKTISHGGAFVGFRADYVRFPEQKISIIVFANRSDANPTQKCYEVANVMLEDEFEDVPDPKVKSDVPIVDTLHMDIDQITGHYEIQPGAIIEIMVRNDSLFALLTWSGEMKTLLRKTNNTFVVEGDEGIQLTFNKLVDGFASEFILESPGNQSVCQRKAQGGTATTNLEQYTGKYYSEELEVTYEVHLKDANLQLLFGDKDPQSMQAYDDDQFLSAYMLLRFQRKDRDIIGFELDAGRAKNIKFTRM